VDNYGDNPKTLYKPTASKTALNAF
jgi:hypothetical protein